MDLIDVARLEESRQAVGLSEIADEFRSFAGGTAGRGEPGSWINNCVGMGLNGSVSTDEITSIVAWYTSAGIEPRFEVAPFVEPKFLADCADLGLRPRSFESVLFRELVPGETVRPLVAAPDSLRIETVNPADPAAVRAYADAVVPNFFPPGSSPTDNDMQVSMRCVRHPRTIAMGAWIDGRLIGGGACEIAGPITSLFGLSVHPDFRRRGVQQALIAARLNLAIRRGVKVATIGSRPGMPTERNVRRMGFQLAYTKVVLARSGPGLVGMVEG